MSNDNKPNLSDLKARLGLKKPGGSSSAPKKEEAASTPRTGGSGARAAVPRPDRPSPEPVASPTPAAESVSPAPSDGGLGGGYGGASPQQPQAPAPRRPGPPPGAMGPPPTAQKKSAPVSTGPDPLEAAANEQVDLKDLGIEDDVGLGLPWPTIALMVVLLVMGLFFGYFASESLQTRSIETARIGDAQQILERVEPRLEAVAELEAIIAGLDPMEVDFDATERLAQIEFAVRGDILPVNRSFLGRDVIAPFNRYMALTTILSEKINEHHRLTTVVDRAALEELMEESEGIRGEDVAVVFHYQHLGGFNAQSPADYTPPVGRLVHMRSTEAGEDGSWEVQIVGGERPDRVHPLGLVQMEADDLLRTGGENALQRHERRVNELQHHIAEIVRRAEPLREALSDVANQDPPALLSFGGSSRPVEGDEAAPVEETD